VRRRYTPVDRPGLAIGGRIGVGETLVAHALGHVVACRPAKSVPSLSADDTT
jgi:hypothetical protein